MKDIMKNIKDITLCSQILDIYILDELYISNMIWKLEQTIDSKKTLKII